MNRLLFIVVPSLLVLLLSCLVNQSTAGFSPASGNWHLRNVESDEEVEIADLENEDTLEDPDGQEKRSKPFGGGFCYSDASCNYNGDCTNATCVCQSNYAGYFCEHKLKSRLTAFLLAFFVGAYGVMRFYLGYIGDGIGHILLLVGGLVLCCAGICCGVITGISSGAAKGADHGGWAIGVGVSMGLVVICISFLGICSLAAAWVWWLIDWILVVTKDLDDYDGYPLQNDL